MPDCCQKPENRVEVERGPKGAAKGPEGQTGTPVKGMCTVCGRNHYVIEAEPGKFKTTGGAL